MNLRFHSAGLAAFLMFVWLLCGCSPSAPPVIDSIEANSVLEGNAAKFGSSNLFDGNIATAWCEGMAQDGTGLILKVKLKEKAEISKLVIRNGFANPLYWAQNNRVSRLKITAGDESQSLQLEDQIQQQSLYLQPPLNTDQFELQLEAVHRGSKWNDTCLTEIAFDWTDLSHPNYSGFDEAARKRFYEASLLAMARWLSIPDPERNETGIELPAFSHSDKKVAPRVIGPSSLYDTNIALGMIVVRLGLESAAGFPGVFSGSINSPDGWRPPSGFEISPSVQAQYQRSLISSSQKLLKNPLLLRVEALPSGASINHYNSEAIAEACELIKGDAESVVMGYSQNVLYQKLFREAVWRDMLLIKILLDDRARFDRDTEDFIRAVKAAPGRLDYYDHFRDLTVSSYPFRRHYFLNMPAKY